jgi:hypothetical protein
MLRYDENYEDDALSSVIAFYGGWFELSVLLHRFSILCNVFRIIRDAELLIQWDPNCLYIS